MKSISIADLQTLAKAAYSWSIRHDRRDYDVALVPSGFLIKGTDQSLRKVSGGFVMVQDTHSITWQEAAGVMSASYIENIFSTMDAKLSRYIKEAII